MGLDALVKQELVDLCYPEVAGEMGVGSLNWTVVKANS